MKKHNFSGGNAQDRRKARRHQFFTARAQFCEGAKVKITTADYGKRYLNTFATILESKTDRFTKKETFVVQAYRRKTPLEVAAEHVIMKEAA